MKAKDSDKMNIGDILIALRALDPSEVDDIAIEQAIRPGARFGELAVERGVVDVATVRQALVIQECFRTPGRESEGATRLEEAAVLHTRGLQAPPVPTDDDDVTPVVPMQEMVK